MSSKKNTEHKKDFKKLAIRTGKSSTKRSDGDRQHYRVGKILNRLEDGPIHLKSLAGEYRVTKRSIERDLDKIELYGYGIIIPKTGWRQFAPGVSLKKGKLDIQQQAALVILNEISRNLGASMHKSFGTIFKHLMECDPGESNIIPIMPKLINTKDIPYIDRIDAAIENRRKLKIEYDSEAKGQIVSRLICPVKILISEGFAYILAISENRHGSPIKYRLDRIKALEDTPDTFTYPENLSELLEKARSVWGILPEKERKTLVRLKVEQWAVDYFKHQELIGGQKTKGELDGSLLFEAKVGQLMEIIPHILHWIPYVTVLAPKELKDEIRANIHEYLKK